MATFQESQNKKIGEYHVKNQYAVYCRQKLSPPYPGFIHMTIIYCYYVLALRSVTSVKDRATYGGSDVANKICN